MAVAPGCWLRASRPIEVRGQLIVQRSFLPSKENPRKFCFVMAIVFFALVVVELSAPRATAPTGRWSWLTGPIFDAFGSFGLAVVWAVLGLFLVAVSANRDAEAHASDGQIADANRRRFMPLSRGVASPAAQARGRAPAAGTRTVPIAIRRLRSAARCSGW